MSVFPSKGVKRDELKHLVSGRGWTKWLHEGPGKMNEDQCEL